MIGRHYRDDYNCGHFVSDFYREKLGIEIPTDNQFDISFVRWLRHNFKQVDKPVENCLVRMNNRRCNHIGVYADYGVYHNYKANNKHGAVVHWTLGVVKRNYEKVTYWIWSK